MSRGERVSANGILSRSMRDNYTEHGVDEYYKKVGSTYRNPHFPGIRTCLYSWLNKWWKASLQDWYAKELLFFDMACGRSSLVDFSDISNLDVVIGSGEASIIFAEWCNAGKRKQESLESHQEGDSSTGTALPMRRRNQLEAMALDSRFPDPKVAATDPYTSAAFSERTGLPCSSLSFRDISEGLFPEKTSRVFSTQPEPEQNALDTPDGPQIEMVVCSFALHLVESSSELFSLLWELSSKARWLVVLAPHKKPEIKDGWGWLKWNVESWNETSMTDNLGEILHERVHCRVYRSVNF